MQTDPSHPLPGRIPGRAVFSGRHILVTGATGLLGRALTDRLLELGALVRAVSTGTLRAPLPERAEHMCGDLADPRFAKLATAGMEGLIHCAGARGSINIQTSHAADMLAGNILLDFHTLEAARCAGIARMVYVSTVSVYPPLHTYQEDLAWTANPDPGHEYVSWAKRMSELLIRAYKVQHGFDGATIVRPVNTYGPHDDFNTRTALVIPALIRRVLDGENPLAVWGDGRAERDFLYVTDAVEGILLAYEHGLGKGPFNLGSGRSTSIRELAETVVEQSGLSPDVRWDPSKPGGEARKVADITRARAQLGFAPVTSLANGIAQTIKWYRATRESGGMIRW